MQRQLFLKLVEDIEEHNDYFTHRADALGNLGLQGIQKITSSI
jgi:bacterioferritin (cytochrome b1)